MICQSTNNCPSNIWTSDTSPTLQHSNTRRHLQTWSCDLLEPGSRDHTFSWRTQQGRRQNVSHIAKILNTHFTWTKHGIKARWMDFYQWRCCDWKLRIDVRICCAIDPWCWAQLGRHQLLSVESQYKYHELRTLNCRLEPRTGGIQNTHNRRGNFNLY